MKRLFTVFFCLILCITSVTAAAHAENSSPIIEQIANGPFSQIVDTEGKSVFELKSDNESGIASIDFDFSEGNKSINISDGEGHVKIHFFFADQEILAALYHTIPFFSEIRDSLPDGKDFMLTVRLIQGAEEGATFSITADDIPQFYQSKDTDSTPDLAFEPTQAPASEPTSKPTPQPTAKPTPKPTATPKSADSGYNFTTEEYADLIIKGINGTLTYEEAELLELYYQHYQ